MKVERIIETCLYVTDLDQAYDFYQKILGLESFSRQNQRHLFFRCGNQVLLLFKASETKKEDSEVPSHGMSGEGHVAFSMPETDLGNWRKHLLESNIPIEREISWSNGGKSIYFRDPAGNSLELTTPQTWGLPEQSTRETKN